MLQHGSPLCMRHVCVCLYDSFEDITSILDHRPVVSNGTTFGERSLKEVVLAY